MEKESQQPLDNSEEPDPVVMPEIGGGNVDHFEFRHIYVFRKKPYDWAIDDDELKD